MLNITTSTPHRLTFVSNVTSPLHTSQQSGNSHVAPLTLPRLSLVARFGGVGQELLQLLLAGKKGGKKTRE